MKNVEKVKPTGLFTNYIYKAIPLAFDESMSYYETLCGLLNYLMETILPALNNNADAIVEVQNKITELKDYVDHYFDNLDVQTEINNKLDEMTEQGQLQNIIVAYLQVAGILGYDTVDDMISSTNLINGSIARTLGQNDYLDGKGAYYKIRTITNDDVVDGVNIIALDVSNTLIAELIPDYNIESINQSINEINSKIDTIKEPKQYKNKKFLFVADSYEVGYQGQGITTIEGFVTKVKNDLNLNAQIIAQNGYGFLGIDSQLKWIDLIQSTSIQNKESFTDIYLLGGMNDTGKDATLESAMSELFAYLTTNFPNAEIHVGCVGKYATSTEANLLALRRVVKAYKLYSIKYGNKYIDNSNNILHNMSLFISDGIHPNTDGENQLAYGLKQYIVNGRISSLLKIGSTNDYQNDTFEPASGVTTSSLDIKSYITETETSFLFDGSFNFANNIACNNNGDIVLGKLTDSYVCGSADKEGINAIIVGYVYSITEVNNSHFVKVVFKMFNDNNNNLHVKPFTVMDNGNVSNYTINQISFPYGRIKVVSTNDMC